VNPLGKLAVRSVEAGWPQGWLAKPTLGAQRFGAATEPVDRIVEEVTFG
jgi:hypothetical protein